MEASHAGNAQAAMTPIANNERIEALDVVRGFALAGIALMNVEFFNRASGYLGTGIAAHHTGVDYLISFFVQYFVTGKFWTIFSLLFGMGFAVMLTRAERAGRGFLAPYIRRIAALAAFGALHYIFLWSGDILFSYAVAAICLMVVLFGRFKWIAATIAAMVAIGFAPKIAGMAGVPKEQLPELGFMFGNAIGLAFCSLAAWWLRGEQRVKRLNMPTIALVFLVFGIIGLIAGAAMWVLPNTPGEAKLGLPTVGFALTTLGLLTRRYHEPVASRPWRLGVGVYCFSFFMMTAVGALVWLFPSVVTSPAKPAAAATVKPTVASQAPGVAAPGVGTKSAAKPGIVAPSAAPAAQAKAPQAADKDAKPKLSPEEARAKRIADRKKAMADEERILSSGTFADGVALRAPKFLQKASGEIGFGTILIGMFLIGYWFVKSGVMENTRAHLPLFRKLATIALPFGVGLGLLGSLVSTHQVMGADGTDGYQFARGLLMLGNLPASLGYVGLVVLMLHSRGAFSRVSMLAPFGRMALTNYVMQSAIAGAYFFGWGFGQFGASRLEQMVYVVCVVAAQIAFSHFWLARFRYGPLEWLWRAVTYLRVPPMRLATPVIVPAAAGAH